MEIINFHDSEPLELQKQWNLNFIKLIYFIFKISEFLAQQLYWSRNPGITKTREYDSSGF